MIAENEHVITQINSKTFFIMEQPKQDNEEIRISTEQIHWSKDDPSKLDLEYHRGVGTLRKAVLIGAVLPLVSSLTSI